MTEEEMAAAQRLLRQIGEAWQAFITQVREALAPMLRFMRQFARWIEVRIATDGPLSPALAYATPGMRRRAAKQRAGLSARGVARRARGQRAAANRA